MTERTRFNNFPIGGFSEERLVAEAQNGRSRETKVRARIQEPLLVRAKPVALAKTAPSKGPVLLLSLLVLVPAIVVLLLVYRDVVFSCDGGLLRSFC
jgi:hypothetical protein